MKPSSMTAIFDRPIRRAVATLLFAALLGTSTLGFSGASSAEETRAIPAPTVDEAPAAQRSSEVVVLAGGCFWGVQGVFQHVKGVTSAISGYTGGEKGAANYETVSAGSTGHAESVEVAFDPRQISYGRILQIYFSVVHDPTELNRQGPDTGSQYRSAIFPADAEQARIAKAYIAQLNQARTFDAAIVTKIEPGKTFYRAEGYHQDYLTLNPTQPYIVYNDLPKIEALKRFFPDVYRPEPVLVAARSSN
jgi:peptide-methionine (S)-S-oxide reductase